MANPDTIPDLYLWLPADGTLWQDDARTVPVTTNFDPVGAWDDESGNDRHITQSNGGTKPIWETNIINGLPAVEFDGKEISRTMNGGSTTTWFIAFQAASVNVNNMWDTAPNQGGTLRNTDGLNGVGIDWQNNDPLLIAALDDTDFHVLSFTTTIPNRTIVAKLDGNVAGSNSSTNDAPVSWIDFTLGSVNHISFADAVIAEVIIYDVILSNSDIQAVEEYLMDKYGLLAKSSKMLALTGVG